MKQIASRSPVNKTASMVTQKGIHFEPKSKRNWVHEHWDVRPQTIPVPRHIKDRTGQKHGTIEVVGLLDLQKNRKGNKWLVRCLCGSYESRRALTLNKKSDDDCCQYCKDKRHLRRNEEYRRLGYNLPASLGREEDKHEQA
uniref:Uncharacterized protein n=1 Tax=viral metagenome TaxID=1070528 RepID=A0A6M3XM73_9ZZZZ